MGRKISIIGSSCSGKTTLAAQLAERLGVPHLELDALHHGPNWQEATADELRAKVEEALTGLDGWVADGNYMGTIRTHHRRRRYWPPRFEGRTVVRLCSSAEADAWLANARA
jgi:adenylate kinase family enzyme